MDYTLMVLLNKNLSTEFSNKKNNCLSVRNSNL